MRIATKAVTQLAKDSGFAPDLIEALRPQIETLIMRAARRERKFCQHKIRAWYFDKNLSKGPLFNVLNEDDDYDLI